MSYPSRERAAMPLSTFTILKEIQMTTANRKSEHGFISLELAIVLTLIVIIALGFLSVTKAMAATGPATLGYSSVGCVPYTRGAVIHGYHMAMTHSGCTGDDSPTKTRKDDSDTPVITVATIEQSPVIAETVITTPVETAAPVVSVPAEVPGNPGNDKPVGNKEHCDKGMCENTDRETGEHGKSSND
jgi:hypothetical protein